MTWQERLVKTETEKELYNLLEPIFRERTLKGDESLFGIFNDLREENQQLELMNIIKNGETNANKINLCAIDIDLRDNPEQD